VRDPDTLVEKYSLVTEGAREALPDPAAPIAASGGDAAGSRGNLCLAGLGENGDRIALEGTRGAWTFAELDALAEGLARRLVLEGLQRGEVGAVYARRDPILVCALLGVLRAGGAFAVLDPGYPDEGLAERWRAAAPRGLLSLTAAEPTDALAEVIAASSLRFDLKLRSKRDLESARQGARSAEIALPELRAEDWAYVAFTSGTTGGIKAIAGTHGPVAHFLDWQKSTFGLGADDRFSMLSGLAHDPLLRDVFAPLWAGARLCVPSEDALEDPSLLADWMGAAQPTVVHLAPAIAQLLGIAFGGSEQRAALGAWRYAFFGGDVLTGDIVARLREIAPNVTCVNFYGATETPQAMSHYVVPPDAKALRPRIPVGWGIDGVQLLVTTPQERLAGIGELGEILVRTPHLSLGYLGDEALTKRRFTPNPFTGEAGDRVYRTGDLGRYLPDGSVLFAGRRDGQVKLRGFRVELGEIEASLCRHESVSEAAVNVWTAGEGDTRLVAYVVARSGSSVGAAADLRKHLRSTLPDYMIPQHFVELSALPLTPNGKLDRKALPSPLSSTAEDVEAAADPPQGETERLIAAVWGEVLGDPEISRTDNFFELGGHSLLAMKAIALIEERTGWRASPRLLILEQLQEVARKCDTERPRAKPERPARGFLARLKGLVGDAE
jgi:amino acid adenylation domain-containing protein